MRFSPGCACCSDTVGGCCSCEAVPRQWELTVAGVTATSPQTDPCDDCEDYNGTFVLTYAGTLPDGACLWESEEVELCGEGGTRPRYTLECTAPFPITGTRDWIVSIYNDYYTNPQTWISRNHVGCMDDHDFDLSTSGDTTSCDYRQWVDGDEKVTISMSPVL